MAGAKVQPIVLAFEDLHWADPTTLDVLRGIAERGALAPLYIVATMRPEFRPPWGMRSHHGTISLAPLDSGQVCDMVAELSARHALSREVIDDVAARTGGVPLFVEEVTRLLLERGERGGIQTIPPTLQQSLMARLDRLGPAREVAQVGAVIGRDFSYALLSVVAGLEDSALKTALERLAEADILLVQGLPPESNCRFKHALIQDAAYENLLKSRRQLLHRRVGEVLRDQLAAGADTEPELLARHFTQAGLIEAASEWWGKAGQRSLARSALLEAVTQLTHATDQIASLAPTPALRRKQIELQVALVNSLMHVKGQAAPETKLALERARLLIEQAEALGEPPEDSLLLLSVLYGFWVSNFVAFNGDVMRELAAQFLTLAEKQGATAPLMMAHRFMGISLLYTGDIAQGQTHLERAIASGNNRVLKVPVAGGAAITLVTGLNKPTGVAVDSGDNVYVADSGNNRLMKVPAASGVPTPLLIGLNKPTGVALGSGGGLYITDSGNNRVLKLAAAGGTPTPLLTGLNNPTAVVVDNAGNLYIADSGNNQVLKLAAGTAIPTPLLTGLRKPADLAVDSAGNLYIIDAGNNQVLKLAAGATTPTPLLTGLNNPTAVAVDNAGNLYITDSGNNRVLMLPAS